VALDAATGEMKWVFSLDEGKRGEAAPRRLSGRGLSYWTDGKEERIIYVTPGYQLIALNAATGRPVPTFGKAGIVDLKLEDDQVMDPITGEVGLHAAPIVVNDVVVIGAAHLPGGAPKSRRNEKGAVRGFDARTGKRLWIFHTIPQPGEFGNDTWLKDSWAYTGNTGNWGQMSADAELGYVYLATEMPTGDYYGGHRPGNNLFADSIVAIEVKTGKRIWYFQGIHHDMWDWDFPAGSILGNITVNGKPIKALAQPSKQGFLYVFDRTNGQPVWPIEERPVPKGDVPGEWYSPTQPFPTKPPAFERPVTVTTSSTSRRSFAPRRSGHRAISSVRSSRRPW
jgi:quinoprotein glucose dehydrogenase